MTRGKRNYCALRHRYDTSVRSFSCTRNLLKPQLTFLVCLQASGSLPVTKPSWDSASAPWHQFYSIKASKLTHKRLTEAWDMSLKLSSWYAILSDQSYQILKAVFWDTTQGSLVVICQASAEAYQPTWCHIPEDWCSAISIVKVTTYCTWYMTESSHITVHLWNSTDNKSS